MHVDLVSVSNEFTLGGLAAVSFCICLLVSGLVGVFRVSRKGFQK